MKLLPCFLLCAYFAFPVQSDVIRKDHKSLWDWDTFYKTEQQEVELSAWDSVLKTIRDKFSSSAYKVVVTNSAQDCGSSSSLVHFDSVTTSLSYIPIPGNLSVSAHVTLDQDLEAPISASVELKRKLFETWITVPCADNLGSCTYDDLCQYLPNYDKPDTDACPAEFQTLKVPCKCPLGRGDYQVENFNVYIEPPSVNIPFPLTGDYEATITLNQAGTEIGCLFLTLRLQQSRK